MILEVCWDGLWTLSSRLSQFHGHCSWLVCEVALNFFMKLVPSEDLRFSAINHVQSGFAIVLAQVLMSSNVTKPFYNAWRSCCCCCCTIWRLILKVATSSFQSTLWHASIFFEMYGTWTCMHMSLVSLSTNNHYLLISRIGTTRTKNDITNVLKGALRMDQEPCPWKFKGPWKSFKGHIERTKILLCNWWTLKPSVKRQLPC